MSKYFITSDWHLNHSDCDGRGGILGFERGSKFSTIQEHDEYIVSLVEKWLKKLKEDDTFYFLGDFGRPDSQTLNKLVRIMGAAKCRTVAVRGNHDHEEETEVMKILFDEVHDYPIWINKRVVLSHCPCNVWKDQLNVHGHLHGAILNSDNHLCASIHVVNYQPITNHLVETRLGRLPKYDRSFLWEPWADKYRFIQSKDDAIYDKDGRIDLSATRTLHKLTDMNKTE